MTVSRIVTGLLALLAPLFARAQDPATVGAAPSASEIEARIGALQESTALPAEVRADAIALYRKAQESLGRVGELRSTALDFERQTTDAPALLAAIRAELGEPVVAPDLAVYAEQDLAGLEAERTNLEAELTAARALQAELNEELSRRSERTTALPEEIARVRQELALLDELILTSSADGASDASEEAVQGERLARRELLSVQLRALVAELASIEARKDLLPARRDLATRRVDRALALTEGLAGLIAERRRAEALAAQVRSEALQAELRRQAPRAKELQVLAQRNEELAAFRSSPASPGVRIEAARADLKAAETHLASLAKRFAQTRLKIRAAGLTNATGRLLLTQRQTLPDVRELEKETRARQIVTSEEDFQLILLQEEREGFVDPESRLLPQLLAEMGVPEGPERDALSVVARDLLLQRQSLLDELIGEYEQHLELASNLDRVTAHTIDVVSAYGDYIEERIVWVKSVETQGVLGVLPRLRDAGAGLAWLVSPREWRAALEGRVVKGELGLWIGAGALALALAGLFLLQRFLTRRLAELGERVRRYRTDSLVLTLRATLVTLLIASPVPLALMCVGWIMDWLLEDSQLVRSVSRGLVAAGFGLLGPSFLLQIVRKEGLAEVHFRWPPVSTRGLRRELRWLSGLVAPLVFLFTVFWEQSRYGDTPHDEWSNSIGRAAFIAYALALAAFGRRTLRPSGPVLGELLARTAGGWLDRTRLLWYSAAVLVPVALAVLGLAGYYYTAERLHEQLVRSAGFLFALVLVNSILHRWLFIARRRLAVEQARARAQARAELKEDIATETGSAAGIEEEKLDIPALDEKTRQLFRSGMTVAVALGLYFIWGATLPALRGLERVIIYPDFEVRSAEVLEDEALGTPSTSEPAAPARTEASPSTFGKPPALLAPASDTDTPAPRLLISLADVILAVLLFVLTLIAALNFPALLEIALLQRLPLDSGSRYAITALTRYAISIVGTSWAVGALGLGWRQIQWLAAALTFGLAFGLQEIFANFVSGLILLAERPIRIGDVVTIGGVEGIVSRIRMRATLIVDWDRREHLIPNKELITGSLVNWTLTDSVTRLIVPVGVAYGTSTELAREVLLRCAKNSSLVLADPPPSAILRRFGESALEFELRLFIPHRDRWPHAINEIHMSIESAFRAAGIEMAIPQQDIHIRSAEGLVGLVPLSVAREGAAREGAAREGAAPAPSTAQKPAASSRP